MQKLFVIFLGLILGLLFGFVTFFKPKTHVLPKINLTPQKQVIGFLPYWLTSKASQDYSDYITTLSYFSLTIDTDGSIVKLVNNDQEEEPGWNNLQSGRMDSFLNNAKENDVKLSLTVFDGNEDSIASLVSDPKTHADNLISAVTPIMKKYGFQDLNLDVESSKVASDSARESFTQFASEVKNGLNNSQLGTLTIDISPTAFAKNYLIDPKGIANVADYVVVMAYDYHYLGSFVTGPVAPLYGAGTVSELDTQVPIQGALKIIPKEKIILGMPLYGYEWETVNNFPRAAIIPSTGVIASNSRVEQLLQNCATCSATLDKTAQESYLIYQDQDTGSYYQIFFPDQETTLSKLNFADHNNLGGVALWALGYEGKHILQPLSDYR